jgi:uncharacterized protein
MVAPGRFVWHDLVTRDLGRAKRFYAELLGWRYETADMGEAGEYTIVHAGERTIGGMVALDPSHDVVSHWIAYVTVEDLEAVAARATRLGGCVRLAPTAIPNTGRFAVVADPGGAVIAPFVYEREPPHEREGRAPAGDVTWNELLVADPQSAGRFYAALFGWDATSVEAGTERVQLFLGHDGKPLAGGRPKAGDEPSLAQWVPHFGVTDLERSRQRALGLAAVLRGTPQEVLRLGPRVVLEDPAGALFGLHRCPLA